MSKTGPKRKPCRKCAYCGKRGYLKEMVPTPVGRWYRSECHFAHRECAARLISLKIKKTYPLTIL